MVQFNCNNGNLFPSYRLPIQSKKGYESLCEVISVPLKWDELNN
jgi:hypothetical protein